MSKARELITLLEKVVDDYNGLWLKFSKKYPAAARGLLSGDFADRFWGGINSVALLRVNAQEFLFIETPGHGWIVDFKGNVVGEEDDGFDDKSLNVDIKKTFRSKKTIIESVSEAHLNDELLGGIDFKELIFTIQANESGKTKDVVEKVYKEILKARLSDAEYELKKNMKWIISQL